MFNNTPAPLDGKLPTIQNIKILVCIRKECAKDVHLQQFTFLIDRALHGVLVISIRIRCPHKGCLVCVGCYRKAHDLGQDMTICPGCQPQMPKRESAAALKYALDNRGLAPEDEGGEKMAGKRASGHREDKGALVTPAATVPTPVSATNFTETLAFGFAFFKS